MIYKWKKYARDETIHHSTESVIGSRLSLTSRLQNLDSHSKTSSKELAMQWFSTLHFDGKSGMI